MREPNCCDYAYTWILNAIELSVLSKLYFLNFRSSKTYLKRRSKYIDHLLLISCCITNVCMLLSVLLSSSRLYGNPDTLSHDSIVSKNDDKVNSFLSKRVISLISFFAMYLDNSSTSCSPSPSISLMSIDLGKEIMPALEA